MNRARVLLADDHTLVLDGFRRLLESEYELVGAVADGRAVLQAAINLKPDVVLMDISMPLLNGIDATRQLKQILPDTKVIFLTMHADSAYIVEGLRAGASGYLLKWSAEEELLGAIREVLQGRTYITTLVGQEVLDMLRRPPGRTTGDTGELTARQREILQLIAEGRAVKEMAAILQISAKTVEFHKYRVMMKLGIRTTAELTRYAIQHRLVSI